MCVSESLFLPDSNTLQMLHLLCVALLEPQLCAGGDDATVSFVCFLLVVVPHAHRHTLKAFSPQISTRPLMVPLGVIRTMHCQINPKTKSIYVS